MLWAKWIGTPLYLLSNLFYPFVQFTIESSNLIEKKFERKNEGKEEEVLEATLLRESTNENKDAVPLYQVAVLPAEIAEQEIQRREHLCGFSRRLRLRV